MARLAKAGPTKAKVTAATAGAGAGAVVSQFLIWVLDALFWAGDAAPDVPAPVVGFVTLTVTAALAYAAGWLKTETVE